MSANFVDCNFICKDHKIEDSNLFSINRVTAVFVTVQNSCSVDDLAWYGILLGNLVNQLRSKLAKTSSEVQKCPLFEIIRLANCFSRMFTKLERTEPEAAVLMRVMRKLRKVTSQ